MNPTANGCRFRRLRFSGLICITSFFSLIYALAHASTAVAAPILPTYLPVKGHTSCDSLTSPMSGTDVSNDEIKRCVMLTMHRLCGDDLVAFLGFQPELTISNNKIPNAYAKGANSIVLSRGLLDQIQSPDELGFVLAHELGHLVLHHNTTSPAALIPTLNMPRTLIEREIAADHFATTIMRDVGFNTRAGADLLIRLRDLSGIGARQHPGFSDLNFRLKDLTAQ